MPPPLPSSQDQQSNDADRQWWRTLRFQVPVGLLALAVVLTAIFGADSEDADESPVVLAESEESTNGEDAEVIEATTTTAAPASTTTSAPTTTAATSTTVDVETVSFECAGQTIEIPLSETDGPVAEADTPEGVCEALKRVVWIDNINSEMPALANLTRAADAWDGLEEAGRGLCPLAQASNTEDELASGVVRTWGSLEDAAKLAFGNDPNQFVRFAGLSLGAFCPELLPTE